MERWIFGGNTALNLYIILQTQTGSAKTVTHGPKTERNIKMPRILKKIKIFKKISLLFVLLFVLLFGISQRLKMCHILELANCLCTVFYREGSVVINHESSQYLV